MPVKIRMPDGETATWNGEKWEGPGPLARLGNRIATDPPGPSDPAGLANARVLASATGASIVEVTAPPADPGAPRDRVY